MQTLPQLLLPAVVLVDDSADDLFFIQRLIKQQGIKNPLRSFLRSEEAVDFLKKLPVDRSEHPCAVLIDLKMPLLDGFELLEWIRNQPNLDTVRVGVVSSSGFDCDRTRAEQLGAQAYYTKVPPPLGILEFVAAAMDPSGNAQRAPMVGRSDGTDNYHQW